MIQMHILTCFPVDCGVQSSLFCFFTQHSNTVVWRERDILAGQGPSTSTHRLLLFLHFPLTRSMQCSLFLFVFFRREIKNGRVWRKKRKPWQVGALGLSRIPVPISWWCASSWSAARRSCRPLFTCTADGFSRPPCARPFQCSSSRHHNSRLGVRGFPLIFRQRCQFGFLFILPFYFWSTPHYQSIMSINVIQKRHWYSRNIDSVYVIFTIN